MKTVYSYGEQLLLRIVFDVLTYVLVCLFLP